MPSDRIAWVERVISPSTQRAKASGAMDSGPAPCERSAAATVLLCRRVPQGWGPREARLGACRRRPPPRATRLPPRTCGSATGTVSDIAVIGPPGRSVVDGMPPLRRTCINAAFASAANRSPAWCSEVP
jgi:hypothetical protein